MKEKSEERLYKASDLAREWTEKTGEAVQRGFEDALAKATPDWQREWIERTANDMQRGFESVVAEVRRIRKECAPVGAPLLHGHMIYRCKNCGRSWSMGLEYGVEDWGEHGRPHQPAPFTTACECGALAQDVSGVIPSYVEGPARPGERYFAYDKSGNKYACGIASVYKPETR